MSPLATSSMVIAGSETHRSEAREVLRRYRALSPADQWALIAFLKEL